MSFAEVKEPISGDIQRDSHLSPMNQARVAYVSLVFHSTHGVLRKLNEQAEACKKASLPFEIVWITSDQNDVARQNSSIRTVQIRHKSSLEFRVKQVRHLNRLAREYDAIFLRYPLVDPVFLALFSPRTIAISEHHTKELEETKLLGDWRYRFEKYGARKFLQRFSGITAVTQELIDYELARAGSAKPTLLTPNSIDVKRHSAAVHSGPVFEGGTVKLVMVCTEFVPWHGLDKVLQKLRSVPVDQYELHLCGGLTADQLSSIKEFSSVIYHGRVDQQVLEKIYRSCHVGLSCFAFERKGMKEGSTLKVREYLASGLPAAYGHHDAAFPAAFPYVCEQEEFDFFAIQKWLNAVARTPRTAVLERSLPYISVESLVRRQHHFARSLLRNRASESSLRNSRNVT